MEKLFLHWGILALFGSAVLMSLVLDRNLRRREQDEALLQPHRRPLTHSKAEQYTGSSSDAIVEAPADQ